MGLITTEDEVGTIAINVRALLGVSEYLWSTFGADH